MAAGRRRQRGGEGAGEVMPADEFVEFAQAAAPRLRRTAFLLCGDWHAAEDLTQSALPVSRPAKRKRSAPRVTVSVTRHRRRVAGCRRQGRRDASAVTS
jgi:DNA-directed RNA polymerase specialized sigma24 family protein